MKALLLAMLMSVAISATDIADKAYWQQDKQKHLAVSATIAATATGLARHYGSNKIESIAIGVFTSISVGILKEYADGKDPLHHSEDVTDVYADYLGAVGGAVVSAQFTWKF